MKDILEKLAFAIRNGKADNGAVFLGDALERDILSIWEVGGMNECKAGIFKTNAVITHNPLVCYGGFGQSSCEHLDSCIDELVSQGVLKRRKPRGEKK
jgi:hypothetical protein